MFNFRPKRKAQPEPIDLHLPHSWNELSVVQLERICKLLIETSRYDTENPDRPTTRASFLTRAFLEIADLDPIGNLDFTSSDSDDISSFLSSSFLCQFRDPVRRKKMQMFEGEIRPISISFAEIMTLATGYDDGIDPDTHKPIHHDGAIEWLLSPSRLTQFPYPEYKVGDKVYHGPAPMMSDVSWRQYRYSGNILSELIKGENMLVRLRQQTPESPQVIQLSEQLNIARAQWLANLFTLPVKHIDPETNQPVTDYFYVSDQYQRNYADFTAFPDYQYQAISLWWQGMTEYLAMIYPKVFSRDNPGKNAKPTDALTSYTRSTATMMKYIGGTEQEVNQTQFTIILQHIQDMADENDHVKEIRNKK